MIAALVAAGALTLMAGCAALAAYLALLCVLAPFHDLLTAARGSQ